MRATLRLLFLVIASLPLFLLGAAARADDWSISRPSAPKPDPKPRAPSRPRPPQLSREERVLSEALADPLSDLLVEELIAIAKAKSGGIGALAESLEARSTPNARVLRALIDFREGAREEAEARLIRLRDEGEWLASSALANIARHLGEAREERRHLRAAIEASPPGRIREELREALARQALASGELVIAREQIDILLRERPRELGLLEAWAGEYSRAGAHEEALRLIDSAIALRRGDLRSLLPLRIERLRLLRASGANTDALAEIESILRLSGSAPYRMSLYELELEIYRDLGGLDAFAERMAIRGDIDAIIVAARLYEELGKDEDAARSYERALRLRRGDRDLRAAYARLLSRMGRLDDVLREYERLVHETRGDPYFTRELALLYDRLGRRADASGLLDRIARAQPRSAELARIEAELREAFGDGAGMRAALERWKRIAPGDAEPRLVLAASYLAEGDEERAVSELSPLGPKRSLRTWSAAERASALDLARIYLDLDLARHAEELLREMLADTPDAISADRGRELYLDARLLLAEALIRPRAREPATIAKRRAEAIAIYEAILLEDAHTPRETLHETRRLLARLLHEASRLEPAIALLEARLEGEPAHEPSRLLLIEYYLARGGEGLSKAVALLEAPSGEGSPARESLSRLVEIRRREGAREAEMTLLKELLALQPPESDVLIDRLIELATLLYLDGEALRYAELAVRRSPSDPRAFRRLGAFYLERSRLAEAREAYRRALALDAYDLETIEALARIALRMNEREEARDYSLRLLRLSADDEQIRSAGLMALRLSSDASQLEELEGLLIRLASGLGEKRAYRPLLLPIYETLAQTLPEESARDALGKRSLAFLIEQLFGGEASTTRRALSLIATLRPRGAERALLRFAESGARASLRTEALLVYGRLGGKLIRSEATRLLRAEPPPFRRAAAWVVHLGGDPSMRRALLDSDDLEIQTLGLLSYFHRPERSARAELERAFHGGAAVEVRAAAALSLSNIDDPGLRGHLAARAIGAPPLERAAAIYALQGAHEAEPRLALALARLDPDRALRELADHALRGALRRPESLGDRPEVQRILNSLFYEPIARGPEKSALDLGPMLEAFVRATRIALYGPRERALAAMRELLRREDDPAALPNPLRASIIHAMSEEFRRLLESDEREIRGRAAELITRTSSDALIAELLRELIARGDEETLRRALGAISHTPSGELLSLLQDIASGERAWPARQAALRSLSLAAAPELGGFFEKIARHDTHSIVRAEAVSALARIPSSRARLFDLSETHPDPWIREQAKNAINGSIN